MIKLTFNLGFATVEAGGNTPQEAISLSSAFTEAFMKLRAAGEDPKLFVLTHRTPKGYDFYELLRNDGLVKLSFGQMRDSNRLFAKDVESRRSLADQWPNQSQQGQGQQQGYQNPPPQQGGYQQPPGQRPPTQDDGYDN